MFARFTLNGVTIADNEAQTIRGGGLYLRRGSVANVINSTISGNQASGINGVTGGEGNGGGIYVGVSPVNATPTTLTLTNVTVTDNEAAGLGGGIDFNRADNQDKLTIKNSIIAGNRDSGSNPDCYDNGTSNYELNLNSINLN